MALPDAKQSLVSVLSSLIENEDAGDTKQSVPILTEFVRAFASSDFTCVMAPIPPGPPAEYEGVDGLTEAWRDWGEAFESVHLEPEEIRERPDAVVLLAKQIAVTRHDGVVISQPSAMLCLFREGLVCRLEFHLDREAALRAGGFS